MLGLTRETDMPDSQTLNDWTVHQFELMLHKLIADARAAGVVVTIELKPLQPLAMRHYEMVGEARIAR